MTSDFKMRNRNFPKRLVPKSLIRWVGSFPFHLYLSHLKISWFANICFRATYAWSNANYIGLIISISNTFANLFRSESLQEHFFDGRSVFQLIWAKLLSYPTKWNFKPFLSFLMHEKTMFFSPNSIHLEWFWYSSIYSFSP